MKENVDIQNRFQRWNEEVMRLVKKAFEKIVRPQKRIRKRMRLLMRAKKETKLRIKTEQNESRRNTL